MQSNKKVENQAWLFFLTKVSRLIAQQYFPEKCSAGVKGFSSF